MTATSALGRRIDLGCHVELWRSCAATPAIIGVVWRTGETVVTQHFQEPNTHRNRRRHARRSAHLSQMTHAQNCEWSLAPYGATGEATAGDSRERPTPCGQYVTFMVETKPKNRVGTMCKRRAEWRDFGGGEQPPLMVCAAWREDTQANGPGNQSLPGNSGKPHPATEGGNPRWYSLSSDKSSGNTWPAGAGPAAHQPHRRERPALVASSINPSGERAPALLPPLFTVETKTVTVTSTIRRDLAVESNRHLSRTVRGDRTAAPCKLGDKSGPDLAMSATVPTTAVREQLVRRSKAIPPLIRAFAIASVVLATRAAAQTWDSRLVQLPGSSARARLFGGRARAMVAWISRG